MTLFAFYCIIVSVLISLIILLCAGYMYRVNSRRSTDDPEKRDYPIGAVMISPITWPLFILASVFIFILKALAYGVLLVLFTVLLVTFRKPFIFKWLEKVANKIGTISLKANTFLIRLFFPQARPRLI